MALSDKKIISLDELGTYDAQIKTLLAALATKNDTYTKTEVDELITTSILGGSD